MCRQRSIPAALPAEVRTSASSVKSTPASTVTLGYRAASSSAWAQCVVARRPSRSPAAASTNAPVQSGPCGRRPRARRGPRRSAHPADRPRCRPAPGRSPCARRRGRPDRGWCRHGASPRHGPAVSRTRGTSTRDRQFGVVGAEHLTGRRGLEEHAPSATASATVRPSEVADVLMSETVRPSSFRPLVHGGSGPALWRHTTYHLQKPGANDEFRPFPPCLFRTPLPGRTSGPSPSSAPRATRAASSCGSS